MPSTVAELLRSRQSPLLSLELYPPRQPEERPRFATTVATLGAYRPAFLSVTYGASGSTRDRTIDATAALVETQDATVVGHLTCVSQSRDDLLRTLDSFARAGVRDILAIRGDMPGGPQEPWHQHPEGLANATELVRLVKDHGEFCVGVAAFPNVHQPDNDPELDARIVVEKAEAGAEYAVTQLFFESRRYVELVGRVRARGCQIPIIPGIAPLTVITQIERFTALADCELPADFLAALRAAGSREAVRAIGMRRAIDLCRELLAAGAPGLQFFTQNRWKATSEVLEALGWQTATA